MLCTASDTGSVVVNKQTESGSRNLQQQKRQQREPVEELETVSGLSVQPHPAACPAVIREVVSGYGTDVILYRLLNLIIIL